MKTKLKFLLLFLSALSATAKITIIKGKIKGKLPEVLRYTAPVNGASGFDIYYSAKVDKLGNFEIKTDINEITFIDIHYNYFNAGNLVVVPGGVYNITITKTKES
ncbi:hypothetical protein [Flavobacterium psychrotrophum]|uniref:hypothetical protein n=1 Tax=Flavobacterium psychrotrophum TaxID=2294119 RepID=UPI000E31484C|nr:hypothetical protein [Flavobacterium psychrotrophum]